METISVIGFILFFLYFITTEIACTGHRHIDNNFHFEQKALMDFKSGLKDSNNRLSSWKGSNYCNWQGIGCENGTTFVVSIDLHNPYPLEVVNGNQSYMNLSGVISPSLIKLKYLKYLDLSFNSFKSIPIPQFFGSMKNLIYLNLSHCGFTGTIPSNLGNLSNLQSLDLSSEYTYYNDFKYSSVLFIENIEWMTNLVSLKHLGANYVNLSMVRHQWVDVLNKLPVLTELYLDGCSLFGSIPSPSFVNFTALAVISINSNEFNSTFPEWLLNISSLQWVDISLNELHGRIPLGLGELPNLQYLDLSFNYYLESNISQLLRKIWGRMEFLNLVGNDLHGSIPSSFGHLCNLQYLDLSFNNLNGSLPEIINGSETCNSKNLLPNLRELDLSDNQLMGKLPSWLGELKNLWRLKLSHNELEGSIPSSIGNFCNLQYLYLSDNNLNGSLPKIINGSQTCNYKSPLPNLRKLYLLGNQLMGKLPNWLGELKSLTRLLLFYEKLEGPIPALQHLEFLSLGGNELNGSMLDGIGQLSQLKELIIHSNQLSGTLSEQHFWKLSQLESLYLRLFRLNVSSNWVPPFQLTTLSMGSCHVGPAFPAWLRFQKNLISLDLSNANISGYIPNWFWNISLNLQRLDMSHNRLQGSIPSSIGNFCNLQYLDLSDNNLNGSLPEIINGSETCNSKSPLPNLMELDLYDNQLVGKLPNWLGELKNLWRLSLFYEKLEGPIPTLQHLEFLDLGGNELNGSMLDDIGLLSHLKELSIHSNQFSGTLSEQHFWKVRQLDYLYVGHFHLNVSSNWVPPFQLTTLSMGSCHIGPAFPSWLRFQKNLEYLDLSNASISSSIPNWFWNISSNLGYLILSNNQLQGHLPDSNVGEFLPNLLFLSLSGNRMIGTIPDSIGHLSSLEVIDFSSNNLIGKIPSTINNCSNLIVLDLGNNNLFGRIPKLLGQLQQLKSLHLNHNMLLGELPSSLRNITGLDVLDLSYNKLSGQIPTWIGTAFGDLVILNLRSNMFSGKLPSQLSNLSSLHVLDLAQNNLIGEIPVTLVNLKAMTQEHDMGIYSLYESGSSYWYEESLIVITKGLFLEYNRTLSLVLSIDLSHNSLSGEFPEGITKLAGLVFLNLSMNHITGQIPESISKLHQLSSLDLSSNKLFGSIPSSMSLLSSLGYLNLSNNNLSGKIPFIVQMSTFLESAFAGNPNLCGTPLYVKCQGDSDTSQSDVEDKIDGDYVDQWFYLSIGLGFAMGILVPYFVLAMKRCWCEAYFDFVDKIVKWLVFRRGVKYARNHAQRQ